MLCVETGVASGVLGREREIIAKIRDPCPLVRATKARGPNGKSQVVRASATNHWDICSQRSPTAVILSQKL